MNRIMTLETTAYLVYAVLPTMVLAREPAIRFSSPLADLAFGLVE